MNTAQMFFQFSEFILQAQKGKKCIWFGPGYVLKHTEESFPPEFSEPLKKKPADFKGVARIITREGDNEGR